MLKAIIGGTGVYEILQDVQTLEVETMYGDVSVEVAKCESEEIAFLPRHGKTHNVAPHKINYRANIEALNILGVKYVLATCAVGSCNEKYEPSDIVIMKDFIDFTKERAFTFFDGEKVVHTDMSDPYCQNLREQLYTIANLNNTQIKGDAVYICTQGPRFETAAEIKIYKVLGGDVVGMTNVPEVVLAKERGMCYSAIGIVTNWCTGLVPQVCMHDIEGNMSKNKKKVMELMIEVFKQNLSQQNCNCNKSMIQL